jgi:hypothetical protein
MWLNELAGSDEYKSRIVELRYFDGLSSGGHLGAGATAVASFEKTMWISNDLSMKSMWPIRGQKNQEASGNRW